MQITYKKMKDHLIISLKDEDGFLLSVESRRKEDIPKILQSFDFFVKSMAEISLLTNESKETGEELEIYLLNLLKDAQAQ